MRQMTTSSTISVRARVGPCPYSFASNRTSSFEIAASVRPVSRPPPLRSRSGAAYVAMTTPFRSRHNGFSSCRRAPKGHPPCRPAESTAPGLVAAPGAATRKLPLRGSPKHPRSGLRVVPSVVMASERLGPPFDHLHYVRIPHWVRAVRGGETVVDSRRALLVWPPGRKVPVYAFPRADVGPRESDAVGYDDPELGGYVTLDWNAVDRWLEEDEEVHVHPRDPFARVDALASTRKVCVEIDGQAVAESSRPVLLFETGLPTRCYLPRGDVDAAVLRP